MKHTKAADAANDSLEGKGYPVTHRADVLPWRLLESRLEPPAPLQRAVTRDALLSRLSVLQADQSLVLWGPVGSGKTQLIRDWLQQLPPRGNTHWLRLENADLRPGRLIWLLEAALLGQENAHPGWTEEPLGSEDRLRLLLAEWKGLETEPLTLVLDGLGPNLDDEVRVLLDAALRHRVEHLRWVMLMGVPPSFLMRDMEADGRLLVIEPEELSLSEDEVLALFRQQERELPRARQLSRLQALTDGWLAPLRLASRIPSALDAEGEALEEWSPISRFIQEKVLDPLGPEQRRALQVLCVADRLCDSLVRHLVPEIVSGCQQILDWGIPLTPIDGQGRWYRLNPLLARYLRSLNPEADAAILKRAGDWHLAQGDALSALFYATRLGDAGQAEWLVARCTEALLAQHHTTALVQARPLLPPEAFDRHPQLRLIYGWIDALAGRFSLVTQLEDQQTPDLPKALEGRFHLLVSYAWRGLGELENARQAAVRALETPGLPPLADALTRLVLSSIHTARGQHTRAREANRVAQRRAREMGHSNAELLAAYDHARIELGKGYLHRAAHILENALADFQVESDAMPPAVFHRARVLRALIDWHWADWLSMESRLDRVEPDLMDAEDLNLLLAWSLRTLLCEAQGRTEDAFGWISRMERCAQRWRTDEAVYEPVLRALKVHLLLSREDTETAGRVLGPLLAGPVPALELFPMLPGLVRALEIRWRMQAGDRPGALALLESSQKQLQALPPASSQSVVLHLLQALVHEACQRQDRALLAMRRALQLAAEEQYVSPFILLGDPLRPLLARVRASGRKDSLLLRLGRLLQLEADNPSLEAAKDLLSERERGVLELIAQGFSNQAIGERLHISLHTVKTHARKINTKLGVRSRTQALVRARELGLL